MPTGNEQKFYADIDRAADALEILALAAALWVTRGEQRDAVRARFTDRLGIISVRTPKQEDR